jgi:hypothetical protein
MTMRIAAILLCLWVSPVWAIEGNGGPVRTMLTVSNETLDVEVTWLQTGGIVQLKIISLEPVPEEKRTDVLQATRQLLQASAGGSNKVMISDTGRLVGSYRLTGWTKPFSATDLTIGKP